MNTNGKLIKTILCATGIFITQSHAGFDFGGCSGSGIFEQEIKAYEGDLEKAVTVGTIPEGIIGLNITLTSDEDVDLRLYGEDDDKIVHWPNGLLKEATQETKLYKEVPITYSGYDGLYGYKGHESISIKGTTPTETTMKAFGYHAGHAIVSYSWRGKRDCTSVESGTGHFEQVVLPQKVNLVGTIPTDIMNIKINLNSFEDIDIRLYSKDGTPIVSWPNGILHTAHKAATTYNGVTIEWSGYNGVDGHKGEEYIYIKGRTSEPLVMKVFGFKSGVADVTYEWGENIFN